MNVIAQYKKDHNLTINDIAQTIGISCATVKSHLYGHTRPKPKNIKRYCESFGLRPYDVFSICDKSHPRDLMGQRFNRLTVIDYLGSQYQNGRSGTSIMWRCQCDCGNIVDIPASHLMTGHTQSCGCLGLSKLLGGGHNKLDEGLAAAHVLLYNYQKSARQRGYSWKIEPRLFLELTSSHCHYCGCAPSQVQTANGKRNYNGNYVYNGVDRIDNTKGYQPDNVRPCCKHCNVAKASMTEDDFFDWIKRVYCHTAARQARFEHGQVGAPGVWNRVAESKEESNDTT